MNNDNNAFSHKLMITWCIGLLWNHPHCELNSSSAAQDVVKIAERIEQALKRGKIEGSAKDSRTIMKDESTDDSDGEKPWLYGLVKSRSSINCSNVFAKMYISLSLKFA